MAEASSSPTHIVGSPSVSIIEKYSTSTISSPDASFVEDGFLENYFCSSQGLIDLKTKEELEAAIETCKEQILEEEGLTDRKRHLVRQLVQLRLRLEDVKENSTQLFERTVVEGHVFVPQGLLQVRLQSSEFFCETCSRIIWVLVQSWLQCSICKITRRIHNLLLGCRYLCHAKCLPAVKRKCVQLKIQESNEYVFSICPELPLATQSYKCAECKCAISFKSSWGEPRLCDYNGHYYCPTCHWGDTAYIPARILLNWDFGKRAVCRESKQFLKLIRKKPVIKIQSVNPRLFGVVEDLNRVQKLRDDVLIMKQYFLSCREALELKLLRSLEERQHFVENSQMYSLQDLIDTENGALLTYLLPIHERYTSHIKEECQTCQGKGYICKLCDKPPIVFPFDDAVTACLQCRHVFHRDCFLRRDSKCPRCDTKTLPLT